MSPSSQRRGRNDAHARKTSPKFFLLLLLAVATVFAVWLSQKPQQNATNPAPVPPTSPTNAPGLSAEALRSLEKLKGKWLRPDGGYVLEIRSIGADSKLEAAYFNPRAINVSRAMLIRDSSSAKVFVELRDTGYPGCTYSLQYDPQLDVLRGVYYQAAEEQEYQVEFARLQQ